MLIWVLLVLGVWVLVSTRNRTLSCMLCGKLISLCLSWPEIRAKLLILEVTLRYIIISSSCLLKVSCLACVARCGLGLFDCWTWVLLCLLLISRLLIFISLLLECGSWALRSGATRTIALILLLGRSIGGIVCRGTRTHHRGIGNLALMMLLFDPLFGLLLLH